MNDRPAKNRKNIALDENDVALIFKEDGHIDLSFPEITGHAVPDHVMAALALSYAVVDDAFFTLIQERFAEESRNLVAQEVSRGKAKSKYQDKAPAGETPHLKIVS